jgi:hypothetical protein
MSQIAVSEIKYVLDIFFERLSESGINSFSFEDDLYWNVPTEQMLVFPDEPVLTIGSIGDDISFLKSLKEEGYTTDYLEVEKLSALFKIISLSVRKS